MQLANLKHVQNAMGEKLIQGELPILDFDSLTFSVLKISGSVFLLGLSSKFIYKWIRKTREENIFQEHLKQKNEERERQFAEIRKEFLDNFIENKEITEIGVKRLQDQLFKGELQAEDVLKSFISKAIQIHDQFNCITQFIPNAIEKARELDRMHMVKGPLHGIPFCVQENIQIEGMSIFSYKKNDDNSAQTALIIKCLEDLGAILFCRTILSTRENLHFHNEIMGEPRNPLNKKLGIGGSGSACLVAAGGSPFAITIEINGSPRIAAHFSGISALKSTDYRLTRRDALTTFQQLSAVTGNLSKCAEDTAIIFQSLTENNYQNKIDGKTVPISWNSQTFESKQKLRIGHLRCLGNLPTVGDTESVLLKAKRFLESTGHIFVELPLDFLKEDFLTSVSKDERKLSLLREELGDKILDKMKEQELDLILSPVFISPALPLHLKHLVSDYDEMKWYTLLWNTINFPCGVVKVWNESARNWKPLKNEQINASSFYREILNIEDECKGMPIGIQIIGRPFHEELVLKTMVDLDEINDPTLTQHTYTRNKNKKNSKGCWQ